jgi:hypothetical protein
LGTKSDPLEAAYPEAPIRYLRAFSSFLPTFFVLFLFSSFHVGKWKKVKKQKSVLRKKHIVYHFYCFFFLLGGTQIRTGGKGFAIHCLTTWRCRPPTMFFVLFQPDKTFVSEEKNSIFFVSLQAPLFRFLFAFL